MQSVIHLVSGDENEQETAFAIAENLVADESGSIDDVAIVAQAEAITAVTSDADTAEQIASLRDDGVSFKACSNTLDMMDMDESELAEGIDVVPEGAVEVTRLQTEGYAYLRP